ncbi:accessory gene regulator B family protein [Brevibacillus laterosporus]
MILRAFLGGYHFKSLGGCAVVTVAIMSYSAHSYDS